MSNPPRPSSSSSSSSSPAAVAPSLGKTTLWYGAPNGIAASRGYAPIAMDTDADGVEDAVGLIGEPTPGAPLFPAAIDPQSARVRWTGPPIRVPAFGDPEHSEIGPLIEGVGRWVVVANTGGALWGLDARTGTKEIERAVSSAPQQVCRIGESTIRVVLKNDLVWDFDASQEAFVESKGDCPKPLRGTSADTWFYGGNEDGEWHARIAGGHLVRLADKRTRSVTVERRAKEGSQESLWRTGIGDDGPITHPSYQDLFVVDGDELLTDFQRGAPTPVDWPKPTGQNFLTSIDIRNGTIRFITKVPRNVDSRSAGATLTKHHIMWSHFRQLDFFDRSGRHLGYIGWP